MIACGLALAGILAGGVWDGRRTEDARPSDGERTSHAVDAAAGARLFGRCAACHTIGPDGVDLEGPNLYGVVGRGVAQRRSRYAYTAALRSIGGSWTPGRLDAWLTNPAAFAPGTRMAFAGLADPRDRAAIIAYLASQGPGMPPS